MLMRFDPYRTLDHLVQHNSPWPVATMAMDAHRDGSNYVISLDLPGVDPSQIEVSVEGNMLSISAERTAEQGRKNGEGETVFSERHYGRWQRRISLSDNLDTNAIDASYDNGVLTLTIPVAESAKPRKIPVGGAADAKQLEGPTAAA
jgi:HSP20 family protein